MACTECGTDLWRGNKSGLCRSCFPKQKDVHQHSRPMLERLHEKIEVRGPDECWPFTGKSRSKYEYGIIGDRDGKTHLAHRVILEEKLGRPLKAMALHTCDNPICCNPRHLYEGTQKRNMADMAERGRHVGNRKLTQDQVQEIRSSGEHYRSAAKRYGVTPSHIHRIRRGERWKDTR